MPADPSPRDDLSDPGENERVWRIPGMSPAAVEAARAAARRAGLPLAVWLSGLIHAVADHEDAENSPARSQ
jgi:hypothetical protein